MHLELNFPVVLRDQVSTKGSLNGFPGFILTMSHQHNCPYVMFIDLRYHQEPFPSSQIDTEGQILLTLARASRMPLHSAFHPKAEQYRRIFLMLTGRWNKRVTVSAEQGRPVSQRKNIAGSPPKHADSASLLSQAMQRNARCVWGARAAVARQRSRSAASHAAPRAPARLCHCWTWGGGRSESSLGTT